MALKDEWQIDIDHFFTSNGWDNCSQPDSDTLIYRQSREPVEPLNT